MKNKYKIDGEITTIYICYKDQWFETIIDTDSLEQLLRFNKTWSIDNRGNGNYYAKTNAPKGMTGRKMIYLHQLICGLEEGKVIDHINRVPLDNRKSNLRHVTHRDNLLNSERINHDLVGISWSNSSGKWRLDMTVDKKQKTIGRYNSIEEAKAAREAQLSKMVS